MVIYTALDFHISFIEASEGVEQKKKHCLFPKTVIFPQSSWTWTSNVHIQKCVSVWNISFGQCHFKRSQNPYQLNESSVKRQETPRTAFTWASSCFPLEPGGKPPLMTSLQGRLFSCVLRSKLSSLARLSPHGRLTDTLYWQTRLAYEPSRSVLRLWPTHTPLFCPVKMDLWRRKSVVASVTFCCWMLVKVTDD